MALFEFESQNDRYFKHSNKNPNKMITFKNNPA
jgi:hypothetical protein